MESITEPFNKFNLIGFLATTQPIPCGLSLGTCLANTGLNLDGIGQLANTIFKEEILE